MKANHALRDLLIAAVCAMALLYALPWLFVLFGQRAVAVGIVYVVWDVPWMPFQSIWARHLERGHGLAGGTGVVFNLAFYTLVIWCILRAATRLRHRNTQVAKQS